MSKPTFLTDRDLDELKFCDSRLDDNQCPTCLGEREYKLDGEKYKCPDDEFGHVQLRLWKQYAIHNIPKRFMPLDWNTYPHKNEEWYPQIQQYIDHIDAIRYTGVNWMFFGQLGVAKTWTATHILKEVVKKGFHAFYVSFPLWVGSYDTDSKEKQEWLIRNVQDTDLLLIDEISSPRSERERRFYEDRLEWIVRYRTHADKPTMITSNMREDEVKEDFQRIYSLLNPDSIVVTMEQDDFRLKRNSRWIAMRLMGEMRPIW